MPFTFQNYRSPLNDSIAARIANQGAIEAQRAQSVGNAWAGAVGNIGQTVAAIPGQIQAAKTQQQEAQIRDLQLKGAQRQQGDIDALDKAYTSGGVDRNAIINALPGHLRPTVQKQFTEADEAALKVGKLKGEAASAERDYFGSLAAGVQPFLTSEDHGLSAAMVALQHAKENGYPTADKLWEQIKANPQALPQMIEQLIASSPKQMELRNASKTADARVSATQTSADRLKLETPKINAETQHATQVVEGTVPMTAAQKGEQAIQLQNLGVRQAQFAETKRHNTVTEGQSDPNAPVSDTAKGIAEYRIPPPSTRSMASGQGKALMDQVLRANPDYDASQFPSRSAMRKAFTSGNQSQQLTALNTAIEHLGKFSEVADALNNGSFKPGNDLYNWMRTQFGDSAVTNFSFARDIMSGELASAMKKSGATDTEIEKVSKALSASASPKQLQDAIKGIAIPMIGGKASTLDQQWKQVMGQNDPFSVYTPGAKSVLQKFGGDGAHAAGVTVTSPSGKTFTFKSQADADTAVAAAKAKGLWQ